MKIKFDIRSGIIYNTIMKPKIIIDTNVIIAALKSNRGASNKLLQLFGTDKFIHYVSVALVIEYEAVMKRLLPELGQRKLDDLLDYICAESQPTKIYYLWRPTLKDPKDDMVLELAVTSGADFIVTYNIKDFELAKTFNVEVINPRDLLILMGELS
ncbi:MAG: putative toxin-antitoxin system toxin component, PIN family [Gammaproteobacteria bacterium]